MAEAIGLGASIIAIVGVARTAGKISKALYQIARDAGTAREEIEAFACRIGVFAGSVGAAHIMLNCQPAQEIQSPVIQFLEKEKVMQQLYRQSKRTVTHIRKVRKRIVTLPSRSELWTQIKWLFRKSEVEALSPEMEEVRSSISMVMHIVQMESLKHQRPSPEKDEIIQFLRNQIRVDSETIRFQRILIERYQTKMPLQSNHSVQHVQYDHEDALLDLGASMVENGTVPTTVSEESSRSSSNLSSYENQTSHNLQTPVDNSFEMSSHTIVLEQPTEVRRSSRVVPLPSPRPRSPPFTEVQPSEESPTESEHGTRQVTIISRPSYERPVSHSVHRDESNFSEVSPTHHLIKVDLQNLQSTTGFIAGSNGPVSTKALLARNIAQNVISQQFANQLGLPIEALDEDEASIVIDFGDGHRVPCSGKLMLEWKGLNSSWPPFPVHCLVCERENPKLVFGNGFVKKVRYYWRLEDDVG